MEKHISNLKKDAYNYANTLTSEQLEEIITYTSDKYYNKTAVISDAIWDMLFDFLKIKNKNSKVLKKVGAKGKNDDVELPYYLGSMDKIKPHELNKFTKWELIYHAPYILSDKLDGVSGLVVYSKTDVKMYTRGEATTGKDITKLIKYFNLPSLENVSKYCKENKIKGKNNLLAIRGEIVMSKEKFASNWSTKYKNTRNIIGAITTSKRINPLVANDCDFITYNILDPIMKIKSQYRHMKNMGFNIVHNKVVETIDFPMLSKYLRKRKEKGKYDIDGIIVTNNEKHPLNVDGNPEYAFAFKDILEDQKATSTIKTIEWKISKDGYINPTIVIEPVDIGGVTVQRITANNAKFVVDNGLGKGGVIELIRSGDVIPKVNKVIKKVQPQLPKGEWGWSDTKVDIIVKNKDNDDINVRNIYFFFSTLKIKGMGERIVEKIYKSGYKTIKQFLKLTKEQLLEIDGFKEKSAENLVNAINKAVSNITLPQLMAASNKLGRGMGIERMKSILNTYPDLLKNKWSRKTMINNIKSIDGWDTITATLFADNYQQFIDFYNDIKKYITIKEKQVKTNGKYSNKKIVLSGFRDKELMEYIEKEGGVITNTVTKNTDILIIKDESIMNTSKVLKAKDYGVEVILKKNVING